MRFKRTNQKQQRGFVVGYALYGIGVLAALSVGFTMISASQDQAEVIDDMVSRLESGVVLISQRIERCVLDFPGGDHGQFSSLVAYPAPNSSGTPVNDIGINVVCPGAPAGSNTLAALGFIPPVPPGFDDWQYRHDETAGVSIIIRPTVSQGESVVRNRLMRRLQAGYTVSQNTSTGEIEVTLATP